MSIQAKYPIILLLLILIGCQSENPSNQNLTLTIGIQNPQIEEQRETLDTTDVPTPQSTELATQQVWFRDFLVANGNCELPCVLGFYPGLPLNENNYENLTMIHDLGYGWIKNTHGYLSSPLQLENEPLQLSVSLTYYLDSSNNLEIISFRSRMLEEIADGYNEIFNDNRFYQVFGIFSPSSVLSQFGYPEQIYLFADLMQIDQPIAYRPFIFLLDYSAEGFLIEYSTEGSEMEETVSGCLAYSHFRFIAFEEGKSIQEIVENYDFLNTRHDLLPYLPVQEAAGLRVDEFSENFLANNGYCVVTNKDIWPLP